MKKNKTIPSPFDTTSHKTEWTCAAKLADWINEIVKEKNIPLGKAEVETKKKNAPQRGDIAIYESPTSNDTLCIIETKLPYYDVFDYELKDNARNKANQRHAKYFCTSNFKKLIWWKTEAANDPTLPEEQQIVNKYELSEIENLDDIEQIKFSSSIKKELERFLLKLYKVHTGKESEPKHAVDEFLVFRLHEKIRVLSVLYKTIIRDKCHKEPEFAKNLMRWFVEQEWSFTWSETDFEKAARQTAYLLVNKILFYDLLQAKRSTELDPLEIPDGLTQGGILQQVLQAYFDKVINEINYETIYTTDFIDTVAFPESKTVVKEIKELITVLRIYNLAKLGYDIIGRIFERLIPADERHYLGQYFTNADVVDLILRFCLTHEDEKVLDPSCGAGTFLVRAYQHKKLMNRRLEHAKLLESLWGNDIAKFPVHLSTINLAISDLSIDKNYPNILKEDFFNLHVRADGMDLPAKYRKRIAKGLGVNEREVTYPRWFDVIVGNPPYTRQEEIPETGVDKTELINSALKVGEIKIAEISKRAGLHAYFFVHGFKFLKDKGKFGFIVSNSWLDVDYGKGLQEFFLQNFKITAIIESKVERWFEQADINTCIVILEKCKDEAERNNNLARFIYLKKPLRDFIPPAQESFENQVNRINRIDDLIKTIAGHSNYYENEELRIYPITQKELWEEGYDKVEKEFVGAKWGKYLRAPEIFFKILKNAKDKLVPLKDVAKVRFGIKTGANEFFYLTEDEIKQKKIEKEFWMHKNEKGEWVPNYAIKSPRECKTIIVNQKDLKYRILMIHKSKDKLKGTNILKYIKEGERKSFHKRPTCSNRSNWYDVGKQSTPDIIWFKAFNDRVIAPLNENGYYTGDRFYAIYSFKKKHDLALSYILNSTLAHLFVEICGRVNLGEGALDNMTYETASMYILSPDLLENRKLGNRSFFKREITSVFKEIGVKSSDEVALSKVKSDRRELDKIIMGDMLGLTEDEQLEVYKAVIDLVSSRIDKAGTVQGKKKTKDGIDIDEVKELILE